MARFFLRTPPAGAREPLRPSARARGLAEKIRMGLPAATDGGDRKRTQRQAARWEARTSLPRAKITGQSSNGNSAFEAGHYL